MIIYLIVNYFGDIFVIIIIIILSYLILISFVYVHVCNSHFKLQRHFLLKYEPSFITEITLCELTKIQIS